LVSEQVQRHEAQIPLVKIYLSFTLNERGSWGGDRIKRKGEWGKGLGWQNWKLEKAF
jgi:hypothetical protein